MKKKDALNILGLKEGYSEDDIKKAYRSLSSKYHPDKEGGSNEKMSEINAARDALLNDDFDPESREDMWQKRNYGGRPDFSEFERRFFRGEDIKMYLHVSLQDLFNGNTYTVSVEGNKLNVTIVPGETFHGTVIHMRGKGTKSSHPNGESGDLYIIINCHNREVIDFVDKYDTVSNVTVDVFTATYGGFVEVETPHGKCKFNVVPNKDGFKDRYRLKGKGMPMTKSKQLFGNHFVNVNVKLPTVDQLDQMIKEKLEKEHNECTSRSNS